MSWALLAILSAFMFSWATTIDKVVVSHYFTDPLVFSLFLRFFSVTSAGILVLGVGEFQMMAMPALAWALGSGVIQVVGWGAYFIAVSKADPIWVATFGQSRPLIAAILGLVVLGERLYALNYVGIVLIMISTFFLLVERDIVGKKQWQINQAVGLMLVSVFFNSLVSLFARLGLDNEQPDNVFFWQQIGAVLTACLVLLLWQKGRVRLWAMLRTVPKQAYGLLGINEFVAAVGGWLIVAALVEGPLGSVVALGALRPFFMPVVIIAINRVRPQAVPLSQKQWLAPWWLVIPLIIAGVYLVSS